MCDLTVIVPGIRIYNWVKLYESIKKSTTRSFEVIFVGPTEPPLELQNIDHIKYIKDFGTPIRCQQIGLVNSIGQYITFAADDGYFVENAIDIGFDLLVKNNFDPNIIVLGKYYEGDNSSVTMSNPEWYKINYHNGVRSPNIPDDCYILNVGLIPSLKLKEIGGWDAELFEVCPMAYLDCGIRMYRTGCRYIIQDEVMFICSHTPGTTGDHGPIHYAQTEHDEPLFKSIYSDPNCVNRIKIDINNWKNSPERWVRRFG